MRVHVVCTLVQVLWTACLTSATFVLAFRVMGSVVLRLLLPNDRRKLTKPMTATRNAASMNALTILVEDGMPRDGLLPGAILLCTKCCQARPGKSHTRGFEVCAWLNSGV